MSRRGVVVAGLLLATTTLAACDYVVVPPESGGPIAGTGAGWAALPTSLETSAGGDLVIDLTLRNDTGAWSAMAADDGPAKLTAADGSTSDCATVKVGTGGHRIAPGVQLRGYQAGTKQEPVTELIRVECAGATAGPGAKLAVDYAYVTGDYNYYDPEANQAEGTLEIPLDPLATGLTYPIGTPMADLVIPHDTAIEAINGVVLHLADVRRTDAGLELDWRTENPGEYPSSVHIGEPPAIGNDGIVYGRWESPDLASVPITPPGDAAEWTTKLAVPADVTDLHLLLSVEIGKARLFSNDLVNLGLD